MGEQSRKTGKRHKSGQSLPYYLFKITETPQELTDIHRLLYRTFVLEIPRYDDPGTDYLVDKYHEQNRYFVAIRKGLVCGVTAVHEQPPLADDVLLTLTNPGS
jgi:hypothetical protein